MTKQSDTRDRVLDLVEQLGVGEAIPSERQLSAEFGVSRSDVACGARRSRPRGLSRAPARRRHVRQRAEDRPGADDDLVHGGHAAARHEGREAARSSFASRPAGGAPRPASCTSLRPSLLVVATRLRLGRSRNDGDQTCTPGAPRTRPHGEGPGGEFLLRAPRRPVWDRHCRRDADNRAHRDQ